jgi:hypothetical protein
LRRLHHQLTVRYGVQVMALEAQRVLQAPVFVGVSHLLHIW